MIKKKAKDKIKSIIARNIKDFRIEAGLTQEELGLKMGYKEENAQSRIYQYESGERSPNKKTTEKLANILNKPHEVFYAELKYFEFAHIPEFYAPLISWIRAGEMHYPIDNLQPEESEGYPVPTSCRDPDCFALRIKGDSMEPEFYEGEIIVVQPNITPYTGMFAVVKYDDKVTLKKLKITKDIITLRPLNYNKYDDRDFKGKDRKKVMIIGKVVEKVKRY